MPESKVKRTIKLIASAGFFMASRSWELLGRVRGRMPKGTCVVLYYHAIPAEHRARFARQMDVLIRWTKPVSTEMSTPPAPGARYSAVTFDDGFENVIENALPELKKRRIPSTLFIVTDALGKYPNWGEYVSDAHRKNRLMSAGQLRRLPCDLVSIGSHTMTHPMLPSLSEEEARRELAGSRARLEKMLKKEVRLFSFPYGAFNQRLVECCREAGYARIFTTAPVIALSNPQEFVTGRVSAEATDWPLEFRLKLHGAYRWLPWAFALKRRVLFEFRPVAGTATRI